VSLTPVIVSTRLGWAVSFAGAGRPRSRVGCQRGAIGWFVRRGVLGRPSSPTI